MSNKKPRTDLLEQARALRAATQTVAAYAPDDVAADQPLALYDAWKADTEYQQDKLLVHNGKLYRVAQNLTSSVVYPPDAEGVLALYRPVDKTHAGTLEDPIPYVYGMDCVEGKYYSYEDKLYLCKADMPSCIWTPGTAGLWQWEEVQSDADPS